MRAGCRIGCALWIAALCAACAREADPPTPAAPAAATAEPVAAAALASPTAEASVAALPADSRLVLDLRDPSWYLAGTVAPADAARILRTAYDGKPPKGVAVTSHLRGAFTRAGAEQEAALLVPGGPNTIDPSPQPATLVVLEGQRTVAEAPFAEDAAKLQWLRRAVDIAGDGVDELLASGGYFQMGEEGYAVAIVSMKHGRLQTIKVFDEAYHSDCALAANGGAQPRGVRASTLSLAGGELVEARYRAPCPPEGAEGSPLPQDFAPIAAGNAR